jgi:hypothetical protein
MKTPTFRDSQEAFEQAIREGRLSDDRTSPLYAGHYMYMGTWSEVDTFKHILTRQYIPNPKRGG